jgi:hypothetical protein
MKLNIRPSIALAFAAASLNGAAILLHAQGSIRLEYTIQIVAVLSLFIFMGVLVASGRGPEAMLVDRMRGGFLAGVVGLVAYDLIRVIAFIPGLFSFNPFRPIEIYGLLILGTVEDTPLTKSVGWAFHIWNGLSFATMYTLAFGRGRLLWAVAWGMALQLMMLAAYPSIFGIIANWDFILLGTIGHIAYGLAFGATARRVVRW